MAFWLDEFPVGLLPAPTLALAKGAPQEVEDRTTGGGEGSQVFLFNCECHTFDEVISQLLKAVPGMTRPWPRSWRGACTPPDWRKSIEAGPPTVIASRGSWEKRG